MAIVRPFRGVRYDTEQVLLKNVITPPYDVITPEMRAAYAAKSPYNVVLIDLPVGDDDRYAVAGNLYRKWKDAGILIKGQDKSFYLYEQVYEYGGKTYVRSGFVGALKLSEFGKGQVFPHEKTLSGPKADRYELMKASKANFSQIFGLYQDNENRLSVLFNDVKKAMPSASAIDETVVKHSVWTISDENSITKIESFMRDKAIYIADGHHRYETALKYRDDMRSFLKGDCGKAEAAVTRIFGSGDLYQERVGCGASVNFLTCHDGFTLHDLYSYNEKHNEANGWNNTDGADDNRSWNCGVEGETEDAEINRLRLRMMKNATAVLLCSRGIPMFLAGDEFGNTQFGNNNPYCQDNIISWLDWNLLRKNKDLFDFFKFMISFRKNHDPIRKFTARCSYRFPEQSAHGVVPFEPDFSGESHYIGIMYAGRTEGRDDCIYMAINTYWEPLKITLPELPEYMRWYRVVDTYREEFICGIGEPVDTVEVEVKERTVAIFEAGRKTIRW